MMISDTMRLNAPPKQKVQFTGAGGYDHQLEEAKKNLKADITYTVLRTEVGKSMSYVILEEFPDQRFNTSSFVELEPLQEPQESVEEIYLGSLNRNRNRRL